MPTSSDAQSLRGVAALLIEARTLYQALLAHIDDEADRAALRGLISLRRALSERLGDLLERHGWAAAHAAPGAVDAASLVIHRQVAEGDLAGALREVDVWDARLRDAVRRHAALANLSRLTADNLAFVLHILDGAPASFAKDVRPSDRLTAA